MKKILANLLIFFIGLAVAFAIAEGSARLLLDPPQQISTTIKRIDLPVSDGDEKQNIDIAEHPDEGGLYKGTKFGRRLHPNRVVTIENHRLSNKTVVIETNNMGYRNREIGPKQGKRFLFLGDSITFADYLHEEETFVRLVEQYANRDGHQWETINAGVGAISLKNELAILIESGINLQPDVVVLNFYLNDFQWSKGVDIIQLPLWAKKSWFFYHLMQAVNQARGQLSEGSKEVVKLELTEKQASYARTITTSDGFFNESPEAFNSMILQSFRDYGGAWSPEVWDYMQPLFEQLKQLSREHAFELVIVAHPIYQQTYTEFLHNYPQQRLKAIAAELDIPVLDLLPPLRDEALRLGGNSIYQSKTFHNDLFFDQCHHSEQGSEFVARIIYDFLLELKQ